MDAALQSEVSLTGLITSSVPLLFWFFPRRCADMCGLLRRRQRLHLQPGELVFLLLTCEGNVHLGFIVISRVHWGKSP